MVRLHANSLKEEKALIFPGIFPALPESTAGSLRQNFSPPRRRSVIGGEMLISADEEEDSWAWSRLTLGCLSKNSTDQILWRGRKTLCGGASSWSCFSLQSVAVNFLSFWLSSHSWINQQPWNSWCSKPDTRGYPRSSVPEPGSSTGGPVVGATTLHRRSKLQIQKSFKFQLYIYFLSSLFFLPSDLITWGGTCDHVTPVMFSIRALASDTAYLFVWFC